MKVLSLFDGISCGRIALERAGIQVEKYYASEIDKYAIQIAQKNYPDTIQIGDVTKVDFTQYKDVDIIIGGSPCQDLSVAKQNRQGLQGQRSGLFFCFVNALQIIRPKYFLLENVASMKKEAKEQITNILKAIYPNVRCTMINSALVSAQQRKRYYWTNFDVTQPEDKGILLKDILESGESELDKSRCITSRYEAQFGSPEYTEKRYKKAYNTFVAEPIGKAIFRDFGTKGQIMTEDQEKSRTLTASAGTGGGNCPAIAIPHDKARTLSAYYSTGQTLEHCVEKKIHTMVAEPIRIGSVGKGTKCQRIYSVHGRRISISDGDGGGNQILTKIDLPDGDYVIRKLTPIECERLQTVPDNYTQGISNTQRYKSLGNGWTVDVIAHILKGIK